MWQRASSGSGGGKYQKVTLSAGESKTVTLPFEAKTIVYADTVQNSNGYSGIWCDDFNFSSRSSFWAARNDNGMASVANYTVGATNTRFQSISADGKTLGLFSGGTSGGTTFWIYGDVE